MKKEASTKMYIIVLISSILSFFFLSYIAGWMFSLIYLIGLLIHEFGHAFAASAYDASVSFSCITPFGAYVRIHTPLEGKQKVVTALAGPLCSLVFISLMYSVYLLYPHEQILLAIFSLTIINFINLLPVYPFDGHHITDEITWMTDVCFLIPILFLAYHDKQPLWPLFGLYLLVDVARSWKRKKSLLRFIEEAYHKMYYIIAYIGLLMMTFIIFIFIWYRYADQILSFIQLLQVTYNHIF